MPYLYWGVTAEFRVGTHQGEGTWAAHGLTRPGRDASDEVYDGIDSEGADLYVGDLMEQLRTQLILADSSQSVLAERPSRIIRRPAKYDNYEMQFAHSQHLRRVKCDFSSIKSSDEVRQKVNKCMTSEMLNENTKEVTINNFPRSEFVDYFHWTSMKVIST